jgi:aquaporin Z
MDLGKRAIAELLGTFWLVFGGCGSAVIAAAYPELGIGFLGVALAFGLTVVTMAYAVGHISGAHFNPAITIGLWAGGRVPFRHVVPYIVFQVAGAIAAAAVLKIVAQGHPGFVLGDFASNGFGDLSPGHYNFLSCAIVETLLTFFFVLVVIGATSAGAPAGFAPLAIGLTLTLILLVAIPVTNGSVNPARSTGPAIFAGKAYLEQLWFFWLAPVSGAIIAGIVGRALFRKPS